MKKVLIFLFWLNTTLSYAQNVRPLDPIDGHYKKLALLSKKAQFSETGIDRKQFLMETNSAANLKRLSLLPVYLTVSPRAFKLPDFPENSSIQTKAELDYLVKLQETSRTPDKVAESLAFADVYYNPSATPDSPNWKKLRQNLFHIGRQIGPWFQPDSLPITANFMAKVWSDCTYYFWALKFQHNRVRPYTIDARIKNLNETNFQAYPSGHASASWVAAYVYQELLPQHKQLLQDNAQAMAFSRELIGVHYPSDSEAGRIFARQFVNYLTENKQFLTDFEASKKEIMKLMNRNK